MVSKPNSSQDKPASNNLSIKTDFLPEIDKSESKQSILNSLCERDDGGKSTLGSSCSGICNINVGTLLTFQVCCLKHHFKIRFITL